MYPASRCGSRHISEKYEPIGKIGEGTYGLVYKAHAVSQPGETSTNKSYYAVKKFKSFKSGDGISPTAIREIKLLRELKNRYIVDLTDVMLDDKDKSLYLVFDYAEHDLLEMIRWHHARNVRSPFSFYSACMHSSLTRFRCVFSNCAVEIHRHNRCQCKPSSPFSGKSCKE